MKFPLNRYFFLVLVLVLVLIIILEILHEKFRVKVGITRKIAHISSGILAYFLPYFLTKFEIILLCCIFILLFIISIALKILKSINAVQRKTIGSVCFPAGVLLTALLFLPGETQAFQFGIISLTISDVVAEVTGIKFGRTKIMIFNQTKSMEGSLAFFVTTSIIYIVFKKHADISIITVAGLLTVVEMLLVFGLDNIFIPLTAAALYLYL